VILFFEAKFFVFLIVVLSLYWGVESEKYKKILLTLASYTFYSAWDYRFLGLILFSTCLDYFVAIGLGHTDKLKTRRFLVTLSIVGNLGVLCFFKYYNFFVENLIDLLQTLGVNSSLSTLNIILPVGISFYTFQTMSYTIDVYREKIKVQKDFIDIAFFVAFFPQLVAGPIVRAADFLPQITIKKKFSDVFWKTCILLFVIGLFKKTVIADNIAFWVDSVFSQPERYNILSVILAVIGFGIQIYCDFSGYSDMAIAIAGMFGYRLPINFLWPYFTTNIREFWRCWHISLSTWLRDYLYISLGGNRKGTWRTYQNLMVTMILGGLWHGSSWNFIFWGVLHGGGLAFHRFLSELFPNNILPVRVPGLVRNVLGCMATSYFVFFCWIFFRAENFSDAIRVASCFTLVANITYKADWAFRVLHLDTRILFWIGLFVITHCFSRFTNIIGKAEKLSPPVYVISLSLIITGSILLASTDPAPFLYFQF